MNRKLKSIIAGVLVALSLLAPLHLNPSAGAIVTAEAAHTHNYTKSVAVQCYCGKSFEDVYAWEEHTKTFLLANVDGHDGYRTVSVQRCADCGAIKEVDTLSSIPQYTGEPYTVVNGNYPDFSAKDKTSVIPFETYSDLDSLGRCQVAYANICQKIMPTEERGDISSIHPTGWQSNMGWERCHLIGFQLAGENANAKNLITGTRYFNVTAMLPFENMIADYVKETNNHVLYRVTPYFKGDELIAKGVQMEAWSVEDNGEGVCFNVFCHNVQPGKNINYTTGEVTSASLGSSKITLTSKTKTYTGKAIAIGSATVTGSTGVVTYTYYTNSACTTKTTSSNSGASSSGKAPKYVGTYYVKATVAADASHNGATSSAAKLVIKAAKSSVALNAKSATYSGKAISIGAASTTGSSGSVSYTYYTDSKCTVKTSTSKNGASAAGKAPKYVGTYYVKAKLAADKNHSSATSNIAKLTISKASQKITVATTSKSYKTTTVKGGAQSFSIGAKATKGSISCSKYSGSTCLTVSNAGTVKIAKGTKAGTYTIKVKIKAASTTNYKSASVIKTITVKVTSSTTTTTTPTSTSYVLNTNSMKFHYSSCSSASRISAANRSTYTGSRSALVSKGYTPCGICHP